MKPSKHLKEIKVFIFSLKLVEFIVMECIKDWVVLNSKNNTVIFNKTTLCIVVKIYQ